METLVLSAFGVLCATAFVVKQWSNSGAQVDDSVKKVEKKEEESQESKFKKLQLKFFSAYFLALLGDWLQGPYVYKVVVCKVARLARKTFRISFSSYIYIMDSQSTPSRCCSWLALAPLQPLEPLLGLLRTNLAGRR